MATKLSTKDATRVERQRRVAQLRELVISGTYKVHLEQVAAALVRHGGLMHGADARTMN
jgi:anti-sigma28 factor (negative regulator of flagellin synthesis)